MRRLLACLLIWATPIAAEPEIGIAFPPVTDAEARDFTVTAMADLGLVHIRFAENWRRRGLTPDPGDFAPLLRRVTTLRAAGLRILLTVQADAPDPACTQRGAHGCVIAPDAPFEAYLTTLLDVVGTELDAIQFGNEWDNQFPGPTADYLALHDRFARTVRARAPELPIVLGGVTGGGPYGYALCIRGAMPDIPGIDAGAIAERLCSSEQDRWAARLTAIETLLAAADYDSVDIHLYDAPGLWPDAVDWIAARTDAPVWVTEFGGPSPELEPADPAYQASRLTAYMAAIRSLPVERAYYFKLTDDPGAYHGASGLFDQRGRPKPALEAFRAALD